MAKYKARRKEVFKEMVVRGTDDDDEKERNPMLEKESPEEDVMNHPFRAPAKLEKTGGMADASQQIDVPQPTEDVRHVEPIGNNLANITTRIASTHDESNRDLIRKFDMHSGNDGTQESSVVRQRHVARTNGKQDTRGAD